MLLEEKPLLRQSPRKPLVLRGSAFVACLEFGQWLTHPRLVPESYIHTLICQWHFTGAKFRQILGFSYPWMPLYLKESHGWIWCAGEVKPALSLFRMHIPHRRVWKEKPSNAPTPPSFSRASLGAAVLTGKLGQQVLPGLLPPAWVQCLSQGRPPPTGCLCPLPGDKQEEWRRVSHCPKSFQTPKG